jgi:AhpD family alkylhydroperoxidase
MGAGGRVPWLVIVLDRHNIEGVTPPEGERMTERCGVRPGQIVYASDGARLGRVSHCHDSGFVIAKGVVFAKDYPVFYDEVLTAEGGVVQLRFASSALLCEEEAEPWDPPRDPVGTAGGVDLEPLRAGMAEIDQEQERLRATEQGQDEGSGRRDRGWAVLARLARALRGGEPPRPARAAAAPADVGRPWASAMAEIERRIAEEVEDFEQEAGCAARGEEERCAAAVAAARLQRRLDAAARRRGGRAGRRPRPPAGAASWSGGPYPPAEIGRVDYARSAPSALAALHRLEAYVQRSGLEPSLLELVRLRASQLNGCSPCVEVHGEKARRRGITAERLEALAWWAESALFTERERAALGWTEAVTRIPASRVDEGIYRRAREHFGERGLIDLTMAIVAINGWNRLAVAFESGLGTYRIALAPAPSP